MCIILLAEKKQLSKGILEKAETSNPHGAGIAWINDKTKTKNVKWVKGVNLTSEGILKLIKIRKIKTPYIVHFRITSIGSTNDQLCHPFDLNALLTENKQSGSSMAGVLFHNGTMRDYKTHYDLVFQAGKLNDTKGIFNKIELELSDSRVMSYIANKDRLGLSYLKRIQGQKLAVLTPKGIIKFGDNWSTVEDITTSNSHGMFSYNSCENDFFGDSFDYNFSYNSCKSLEDQTNYNYLGNKSKNEKSKRSLKKSRKNARHLEQLREKLQKKLSKKERKKINKKITKLEKKVLQQTKTKLNALNTQNKMTSYTGHGVKCTCIDCMKIKDKQEIDLNRVRMENKTKLNALNTFKQSENIVQLQKLNKSLITRKYENEDRDYLNDLLDNEYVLSILGDLDKSILTDRELVNITSYLKSITYEMYDNIFCGSMTDKELFTTELIELSKDFSFKKGWKNEQ